MGSIHYLAFGLTMGTAIAILAVFTACVRERSANKINNSIDKLRVELSRKLDQLHKRPEEYYE